MPVAGAHLGAAPPTSHHEEFAQLSRLHLHGYKYILTVYVSNISFPRLKGTFHKIYLPRSGMVEKALVGTYDTGLLNNLVTAFFSELLTLKVLSSEN